MMDPYVRGNRIEAEILDQLPGVCRLPFTWKNGLSPDHGVQVQARQAGVHLEITTLVVPGVNDDDASLNEIAGRIVAELGADVPWHLSGYFPAYQFGAPPTPLKTLERALALGRGAGLEHVYLGNVAGHPAESTYCPSCGMVLVRRWGLSTSQSKVKGGSCPQCGYGISGVGWG